MRGVVVLKKNHTTPVGNPATCVSVHADQVQGRAC